MIVIYVIFAFISIICFIPRTIPRNIKTDDEFSLFENSLILSYCRKEKKSVPKSDTKKLEVSKTDENITTKEPDKSNPFMILGKEVGSKYKYSKFLLYKV